jgi:hypothetical protein
MKKKGKKGFFGSHAKSSAMVVSLVIHAILIVVAVSFVAVKVIVKDEQKFEAKQVSRPKIKLRKLKIPVKVKKQQPKPKLRKRLVAKANFDRKVPEFKMPEISGVKGGLGSATGDLGLGSGGVGFSMPEINIFGVKSRGEKAFLILDADAEMMYDEMGGITAYTIIKNELIRIVDELPPTVLFNVAVFQRGDKSNVLFPSMVSASHENVVVMKEWLDPLNRISESMGDKDFGVKTIGPGGAGISDHFDVEPIESFSYWINPALLAMKQQADSVYLLTSRWGTLRHRVKSRTRDEATRQKSDEVYEKAKQKLAEENEQRRKNGDPPRVLAGRLSIIKAYFPDAHFGGGNVNFDYTPKIMNEAMDAVHEKYRSEALRSKSGLAKRKKGKYSANVIHFVRTGENSDEKSKEKLKQLTSFCNGEYRTIAGLEAIQCSIAQE